MIKIWIINHSSIPPELGGLNRHYYFSKYLTEMGYDVKIITSSAIHNTDINIIGQYERTVIRDKKFGDVMYTYLKTSNYQGNGFARVVNFLQFPLRLMRHYKKLEKPDVIYASTPYPLAAFAAIHIAKKLKIPVILEVRDLWPETIVVLKKISPKNPIIWLMYRMERWMYLNAARIVFTFEGGKDYIRNKHWENDIDTSKIDNINNGIDTSEFAAGMMMDVTDPELLDPGTFKVAYAGSIRMAYGLETLLDAAGILMKNHGDIRFLIWGEGNYKGALIEKCRTERINNVSFKGHVPKKMIPALLSKVNVNVILLDPSYDGTLARYGCSHNKLFDYLASGRPVIMNYKSGYNLLERYHCGMVSNSPSAQDLAKAILCVYNMTQEQYSRLSQNARKAVLDFDYRVLSVRLHNIIRSVLPET